jgi:hypothetical protein
MELTKVDSWLLLDGGTRRPALRKGTIKADLLLLVSVLDRLAALLQAWSKPHQDHDRT